MVKSGVKVPLLVADIESQTPRAGAGGGVGAGSSRDKGKAVEGKHQDYVSLGSSSIRIRADETPAAEAAPAEEALSSGSRHSTASLGTLLMITVCLMAVAVFLSTPFVADPYDGKNSSAEEARNAYLTASRTGYHFQPEKFFMNGPMYYKGYYHLFYQYNPKGSVWGNICWGHAVSTDLVNWMYLELALVPDQWYDAEGVWSGSATILEDGTPAIMYTGSRNGQHQSQSMAVAVDPSDPLLRKWRKVPENPILLNPTGISPHDFRDPTTAWLESDGLWRITIGAKTAEKTGIALLYQSKDFKHWELQDTWLHQVNNTGMWECVDFFPVLEEGKQGIDHSVLLRPKKQQQLQVEGLTDEQPEFTDNFKYVFKVSLDNTRHDHYAIGTYSTETHTFTTDRPGIGPRYDYGKFYASKTFFDSKTSRRILWGWANESDSENDDISKGWASVQALPRTIWLDSMTGSNILQWPVEEVEQLRSVSTRTDSTVLEPKDVIKVKGGDGPQLDIEVVFEKPNVSVVDQVIPDEDFDCSQGGSAHRGVFGPFGILVLTDDNVVEHTAVFFYLTPMKNGQWNTRVCSDQSRSSLAPDLDTTVYGSFVSILPTEDTLALRVLVDHSIVETFVQGGRLAITSRVYPTLAIGEKSRLFLFNNGTRPITLKSLDVYQMNAVAMHAI